jgi:hypothetical protein
MESRFQLVTKTPDPLIAKTYLSLSNSGTTSQEIFSFNDPADEEIKEKPRQVQMSGEELAVARWFDDEAWEAQQRGTTDKSRKSGGWFGGKGKGKGKWVSRGPDAGPSRQEKGVKI